MLRAILRNAGIQPARIANSVCGWGNYVRDRKAFRLATTDRDFPWGKELPILTERNEQSGSLGGYFYQDQLVARWIFEANPARHVDIGSRLDGFVGALSVFREVEVIDIRPQGHAVRNLKFHQFDLMQKLGEEWIESTSSLSCLHTIEHFGLGRYGDPIDPAGHLRGLEQMKRMLSPGGMFYLSTQTGPQRIEFNAHRVFDPETLIGWFANGWTIERCASIEGDNVEIGGTEALTNFRGNLGIGIVAARKC